MARAPQHRRVEILFRQMEFIFNRECGFDPPALAIFPTAYLSSSSYTTNKRVASKCQLC
jgi:hypothetical protein